MLRMFLELGGLQKPINKAKLKEKQFAQIAVSEGFVLFFQESKEQPEVLSLYIFILFEK